jgi:hypothetical protein
MPIGVAVGGDAVNEIAGEILVPFGGERDSPLSAGDVEDARIVIEENDLELVRVAERRQRLSSSRLAELSGGPSMLVERSKTNTNLWPWASAP